MVRGITLAGVNVPAMSVSLQANRNPLFEESIGLPTQTKVYGGAYSVSGSVTAAYRPSVFTNINTALFNTAGSIATTSLSLANTQKTVSIEDDEGNVASFGGVAITSMELTLNSNEYAKVTYNWIGRSKLSTAGTVSAALFTGSLALFYNAEIMDGTVTAKGFSIKINRPLNPDNILGTEYAVALVQSGQLTVTGTLTFTSEEYTKLESVYTTVDEAGPEDAGTYEPNSAHKNTLASITNLKIALYSDASTPALLQTITIGKAYLTEASQSASGRNPWEKTVNWVAEVSNDNTVTFV